jgi:hypothetical protein
VPNENAGFDIGQRLAPRWCQAGGRKKNPQSTRDVGPFVTAEIVNKADMSKYVDFVVIKAGPSSLYRDHDQ